MRTLNAAGLPIIAAMLLAGALLIAAPARANVTPSVAMTTPTSSAAGAHSDVRLQMSFAYSPSSDDLRNLRVDLPAGLVGNPMAIAAASRCGIVYNTDPAAVVPDYSGCPASSDVGDVSAQASHSLLGSVTVSGNVFLMRNQPSAAPEIPAYLGIHMSGPLGTSIDLTAQITVRASDNGLRVRIVEDIARTLMGNLTINSIDMTLAGTAPGGQHFLTNPTRCDTWTGLIYGRAWDSNSNVDTDLDGAIAGNDFKASAASSITPNCTSPAPFAPTITASTTPSPAGGATDFSLTIANPTTDSPPLATHPAHLKRVVVTLPAGMEINPAAAGALGGGCGDAQFGKAAPDTAATCPAASRVGTITVTSPLVGTALSGQIFLGQPGAGAADRYRLFIEARGAVNLKLEGRASVAADGRVTATFGDPVVDRALPQLPYSNLQLTFANADPARSLLTNPHTCGTYAVSAQITPWTDPVQAAVTTGANFTTTAGTNPGGCTLDPFSPGFTATVSTTTAGAHPDLTVNVTRADRTDDLRDFTISLPAGMVGSLTAVPLCAAATAAAGACTAAGQVGSVAVGIGSQTVTTVNGTVHMSEPQGGDLGAMSVQVPAVIGPFDLGVLVIPVRIVMRADNGLDAIVTDVPKIFAGVPTHVRSIALTLLGTPSPGGRPLLYNTTSCDPQTIGASFGSWGGVRANASAPYQATGCGSQPFDPGFAMTLTPTAAVDKPAVAIETTLPAGNDTIKRVRVRLPSLLTINVAALTNICAAAQAAATACPAATRVGGATVRSPLLPAPLTGDVHLVEGGALPGLAVFLTGALTLRLDATNALDNGSIVTTFDALPPLVFDSLRIDLNGGAGGIMKVAPCGARPSAAETAAEATLSGHGGATVTRAADLRVALCGGGGDQTGNDAKILLKLRGTRRARSAKLMLAIRNLNDVSAVRVTLPRGMRLLRRTRKSLRTWKRGAAGRACNAPLRGGRQIRPRGARMLTMKTRPCAAGALNATLKRGTVAFPARWWKLHSRCKRLKGRKRARCAKRLQLTFVVSLTGSDGSVSKSLVRLAYKKVR